MDESLPMPAIGAPATRALALAGYHTLNSLDGASARELVALHGVGPKAIRIITAELQAQGGRLVD